MRRRRSDRPLHLVELDVRWPPETFLCWKLEGLAARGMRVTVASRSVVDLDARLEGVELVALPPRGASAAKTAGAVRRAMSRLRPDIVHIEWGGAAARYGPMFERWHCPVVISCHGSQISANPYLPGYEDYAAGLPALLRAATAIHCVSESLQRTVLSLGVDPDRAHVIRQGVDPAIFRPATASGARQPRVGHQVLRVISIGWPRWIKGFEWALQAIRALADSGVPVQLEIVGADAGEPSERSRLRHTVDDLELGAQVQLHGSLPSAEVARRLSASDALLLPSLDEGLPTVVLEAMACGVPVVASDCGGVSEALSDGVEGFLVAPRDPGGLARALERLWREPELGRRMGDAGRQTASTRFTLERQLEEFLALYEELARR